MTDITQWFGLLSEDDRIFAIERSANALKGGDGTGLVLDALSGAFRDIGQNPSLAVEGVTVQESFFAL